MFANMVEHVYIIYIYIFCLADYQIEDTNIDKKCAYNFMHVVLEMSARQTIKKETKRVRL